jgi:hypothetical protein
MKKMTIEVSDAVHGELMRIQLDRKLKKHSRISLAEVASDELEEKLVTKKPSK